MRVPSASVWMFWLVPSAEYGAPITTLSEDGPARKYRVAFGLEEFCAKVDAVRIADAKSEKTRRIGFLFAMVAQIRPPITLAVSSPLDALRQELLEVSIFQVWIRLIFPRMAQHSYVDTPFTVGAHPIHRFPLV